MIDLNNLRILVVEDEMIIREMIAEELENAGAQVIQAENGKEAFEIFKTEVFDIVISDVRMPKGTGTELMEKIFQLRTSAEYDGHNLKTQLFLCSAFGEHSLEQVREFGVQAIINKPFNWDSLFLTLGSSLDESRRS